MRFFLVLFLSVATSSCSEQRTEAHSLVAHSFPAIELERVDGVKVDLSLIANSEKPMLLNVWATWCSPCIYEMPDLHALLKLGEFNVVTIATDGQKEKVNAFLEKYPYEGLPVFWDKLGALSRKHLRAVQLPTTYLVHNGEIKAVYAGIREWHHPDMIKKLKSKL